MLFSFDECSIAGSSRHRAAGHLFQTIELSGATSANWRAGRGRHCAGRGAMSRLEDRSVVRSFRRRRGQKYTKYGPVSIATGGETWQDTPVLLLPCPQPARAAATLSMAKLQRPASIRRRHAGDAGPLRPGLALELEPDMDEQRRKHHGAADDGAPDGTSPWMSQTQIGPRIGSKVPSRAAKAAGISRAPVAKKARPRPRLMTPKANRKPMSWAETAKVDGLRGGKAAGQDRAEAGRRRHADDGRSAG